ncbi:hypothetical protein D3C71_1566890 [compost metagenome]
MNVDATQALQGQAGSVGIRIVHPGWLRSRRRGPRTQVLRQYACGYQFPAHGLQRYGWQCHGQPVRTAAEWQTQDQGGGVCLCPVLGRLGSIREVRYRHTQGALEGDCVICR